MAKTIEDLEKSRQIRQKVIRRFGEVPTSIWNISYGWGKSTIELDSRKQQAVAKEKHKKMDYNIKKFTTQGGQEKEYNQQLSCFATSSQNVRGKSGGLSTFPPDLCRKVVEFYTEENDTVLDPCMGHASRIETAFKLKRNYIGYDICFMDFNRKIADILLGKTGQSLLFKPSNEIKLYEHSSEKMHEVQDGSVDLAFTSPPYFSIEFYNDHPDQLGYGKTYEQFLEGLYKVIAECYRCLKPNKFIVFNVNDFRKDGDFYMYHADTARLIQKAGFKLWDIVIIPWQSCIGACFAGQIWERKVTAKKHEFLIIGRKV